MTRHIYKCLKCGTYTMKEIGACGNKATIPKPLKYSPDDKYADYRRKAKAKGYAEKGLI